MRLPINTVRSQPQVSYQAAATVLDAPVSCPPALLRRHFACRTTLQQALIGYLPHGGLYLTSEARYPLKTRLCLLLRVAEQEPELCLPATVVMTGPLPGAWAGRAGVGLAFSDPEAASSIDALMRYNHVSANSERS